MPANLFNRILQDRRFWRGPAPQVIVWLVIANVVVLHWKTTMSEARRANLTTGDVSALERTNRYDYTCGEDLLGTWDAIPDATKRPLVVVCGMSQMFTINERMPGDQQTSEELDDRLASLGTRVYGLSAPNMCNEEALFLLLALLEQPKTTPRSFIYGVCFDKFRNIDLRPGYLRYLQARPHLAATWQQTALQYRSKYPLAADKLLKTLRDLRGNDDGDPPMRDAFEDALRSFISAGIPVVAERKELNAFIKGRLHGARTLLLGIKTTSKRPIIQTRYDMNREFLELMIDVSKLAGVRFIPYVVPLNPRAENPYIADEYAEFKSWIAGLTASRSVPFANLEDLVPSDEWGTWLGGRDFKHFKGAGHRLVAAKLAEEFGPLLADPAEPEVAP